MRLLILLLLLPVVPAYAQSGWRVEVDSAPWAGRHGHNLENFVGQLWVFNGGYGANPPPAALRGIWSSVDGKAWVSEGSEPWGQRGGATSLVFNGRMWMLGGSGWSTYSDVWSTDDGVNWTLEASAASWSERTGHAATVFDGRMWVLGGWRGAPVHAFYNDVWSSPDGVNWTLETISAPWSPRAGLATAAFDNKLWVFGGIDDFSGASAAFSDVWSTTDGINWTQEATAAPWGARMGLCAQVYNGRIHVFGGAVGLAGSDLPSDAWFSDDGIVWHKQTSNAPWLGRVGFGIAVLDDRLWIAGGRSETNGFHDDVWSYGFHASPDDLPSGIIQEPYSTFLEAREGDGPYLWELIGGTLAPGLSLDTSSTTATAAVSGTPEQIGTFIFTIRLTDSNSYTTEQDITIRIKKKPSLQSSDNSSGCSLARAGPGLWALLALVAALGAIIVGARLRVS